MLTRLMDDRRLALSLLPQFLEDMRLHIGLLREAHQSGEIEKIRFQAHSIKGASANLAATGLRDIAGALEMAGKEGDLNKITELMPELDRQFERLAVTLLQLGYVSESIVHP